MSTHACSFTLHDIFDFLFAFPSEKTLPKEDDFKGNNLLLVAGGWVEGGAVYI